MSQNANVGAWQNTLMFMGDDGNGNLHMQDADDVANDVLTTYPAYLVKKVMWDAYTRETSSSGNTYPEATRIIKQQQAAGALIMDYAGHGDPTQIVARISSETHRFCRFPQYQPAALGNRLLRYHAVRRARSQHRRICAAQQ